MYLGVYVLLFDIQYPVCAFHGGGLFVLTSVSSITGKTVGLLSIPLRTGDISTCQV